jgi:MoaE-MoaD fusion protein
MQVRVRLFAALRERAGWSERSVELAPDARVGDVWDALGMGEEPPGIAYARNREYAARAAPLADGDEVALIPPVSGGAFRLVDGPLDVAAVMAEAGDPQAGAIASFVGTTRAHNRGRTVVRLRYEAYDGMAESEMARIASDLTARHGLTRVAMAHRVGEVPVGQASVVIAVSAPHRAPALAACAEAIDTLKRTVPIWKKEVFEGGEEWIGHHGDNPPELEQTSSSA